MNFFYFICVWQECLLGLLSSKTVVYVTHQVEFLPAADLILVSISQNFAAINSKSGSIPALMLCLLVRS